jgi:hypothetical protein
MDHLLCIDSHIMSFSLSDVLPVLCINRTLLTLSVPIYCRKSSRNRCLNPTAMKILLNPNGWLTDEHMSAASKLLRSTPGVVGFNDSVLQLNNSWVVPKSGETYIQFLHVGQPQHWITITNKGHLQADNSVVDIYDSLQLRPNSQVIKDICKFVNCSAEKLTINVVNVQTQHNGNDCGVFAIAFATTLAYGGWPVSTTYTVSENMMRLHLSSCFQSGSIEPFPSRPNHLRKAPTYSKTLSIPLYCVCRSIDDGQLMVQCDRCKRWFHGACFRLKKPPPGKWFCSRCV